MISLRKGLGKVVPAILLQDCAFLRRKSLIIPTQFRSFNNRLFQIHVHVQPQHGSTSLYTKQHWRTASVFKSLTKTQECCCDGKWEQNRNMTSTQCLVTPITKRNVTEGCPRRHSPLHRHRHINTASIVNACPDSIQPYLRLIRFDKPIGTWLLYLPCTWSIAMATEPGCLVDIKFLTLFGVGALVMRGAGCTINDMWDSDFDRKVARTVTRPIASGQISHFQALVFLGAQLSCGLAILLSLNTYSIILGACSMGLVVTYPLMKRITFWPQIFLGLAINWGILVGWSAVKGSCDWSVCLPLYLAGFFWTMAYDTIYAHQDKSDDIAIGVKSTAILFGDQTKYWLSAFSIGMVANLALAGLASHQTWPYFAGVGLTAAHLAWQVIAVDLNKPEDCLEKFKTNKWLGMMLCGAIMTGILLKTNDENPHENTSRTEMKEQ